MTEQPPGLPDPHFVLQFMDDQQVEGELDLDHSQLVIYRSERRICINLSGNQYDEVRGLPSVAERFMPAPEPQARQSGFEQGIAAAAEYVEARPNEQPAVLAGLMRDLGSMYAAERPAPDDGPDEHGFVPVTEEALAASRAEIDALMDPIFGPASTGEQPAPPRRRHYEGCPHETCQREDCYSRCMDALDVADYTERARKIVGEWAADEHRELRMIGKSKDNLPGLVNRVATALSAVASERDAAAIRAFGQRVWSDTEEVAYQAGVSDTRARLREPDEELIEAAEKAYRGDGWKSSMSAAFAKIAEMLK